MDSYVGVLSESSGANIAPIEKSTLSSVEHQGMDWSGAQGDTGSSVSTQEPSLCSARSTSSSTAEALESASDERRARNLNEALCILKEGRAKRVNMFGLNVGDEGMAQLASVLADNTTTSELNLSCNQIGPSGASHLAQALMQNHTLINLNLRGNAIRCEGVRHISDMLQHNQVLAVIDLGGNGIMNAGVKHLAAALEINQSLHVLSLTSNPINSKCVDLLLAASDDSSLKCLDVHNCAVSDDACARIATFFENKRPRTILTLAPSASDGRMICSTISGEEVLELNSEDTFPDLLEAANVQLGLSEADVRILRPGGMALSDPKGTKTLQELLSCSTQVSPAQLKGEDMKYHHKTALEQVYGRKPEDPAPPLNSYEAATAAAAAAAAAATSRSSATWGRSPFTWSGLYPDFGVGTCCKVTLAKCTNPTRK